MTETTRRKPYGEQDYEILQALQPSYGDEPVKWHRPLDIGAGNGSWHSAFLAKLATHGMVEWKPRGYSDEFVNTKRRHGARGSKEWRISQAGLAHMAEVGRGIRWANYSEWKAWFDAKEAQRAAVRAGA